MTNGGGIANRAMRSRIAANKFRGAMQGLTAFNRDNRWGRLYKWDQAVLFAIYGENLAAQARAAGQPFSWLREGQ